jgi:hypothetical protein
MAVAVAEQISMAKKRGRPKGDREDATVRLSRPMASKLKMLAGDRGVSVAEVADELCGPVIDRAYAQLMRKLEGRE